MIDPSKIKSHNSEPKEAKDLCDQPNIPNITNLNTVPNFNIPPGFELYSKSLEEDEKNLNHLADIPNLTNLDTVPNFENPPGFNFGTEVSPKVTKDFYDQASAPNLANLNNVPNLDFPPGYESVINSSSKDSKDFCDQNDVPNVNDSSVTQELEYPPGYEENLKSSPKDTIVQTDLPNPNNLIATPNMDYPPGFEFIGRSKPTFEISNNENNDLSFPPGFGNINFTGSLPAKLPINLKENKFNISAHNENEQFTANNSQNLQNNDSNSAYQMQQHLPSINEANQISAPSFSNIVYNIKSGEPYQHHSKPDSTKYEKLKLCSNLLSMQNFKLERDQIEKMISGECQLCENKINKFVNELDQRNKKIESMFQSLGQKVDDCTTSNLYKSKSNLLIDDIVDTRNEIEIENFLRKQSDNNIFNKDEQEANCKQLPKQETILNLLSILCRIYKRDNELAFLWVKNVLSCINQITDVSRLRPILLEIKRVMSCEKDISNIIDPKLL